MELNYLYEFMSLATYRNFHVTAERVGLSQSTLTNHIKALERELDATLFDRNTRCVQLSEYGKVFLPYAERFVELYNNSIKAINAKRYNDKVVLTVAIEPQYMLGDLVSRFNDYKKENKGVVIEFVNAPESGARNMLRSGRCDMCITPQASLSDAEFKTLNIRAERAVAIVKRDHPFAVRQSIDVCELKNETLFVPPTRLILYKLLTAACRTAGVEPSIGCLGASEQMAMALTKQGLGISILSDYSAAKMTDSFLRIVALDPELRWYLNLLYVDARSFSLAQDLRDYICTSYWGAQAGRGSAEGV